MSIPGISPGEVRAVTDSWEQITSSKKAFGVKLFIELFKAYPEYLEKFPLFKGVPLSELENKKKLAAHATNVVTALSTLVENLEDPECFQELAKKIGRNHVPRKIDKQAFLNLKNILMPLMKGELGNHLTQEGENGWNKTIDEAYKYIFEQLS